MIARYDTAPRRFTAAIVLALLALPAKADQDGRAAERAEIAAVAAELHVFRAAELMEIAATAETAAYADEAMLAAKRSIMETMRQSEIAANAARVAAENDAADFHGVILPPEINIVIGTAARAEDYYDRAAAAAARAGHLLAANWDEFERLRVAQIADAREERLRAAERKARKAD